MQKLIGRRQEKATLLGKLESGKSEFVAVYGRRRVGKTFLIRSVFENNFTFTATALSDASMEQQLTNFHTTLQRKSGDNTVVPSTWFAAFNNLIDYLEAISSTQKKTVFIDELPWFDTPKSNFVPALEHFWNHWASARADILLIVCGSAASWILNKLINNRGGLHNRVTQRMKVEPFTLHETEEFLQDKGGVFDRYQLVQIYMVMGGIPFYLDGISSGLSATQNIDTICFSETGFLRNEYNNLYKSIFKNADRHEAIIQALATKTKGLNRNELLKISKLSDGGSFTKILKELEESGFIRVYLPFGKKKRSSLYQLIDFYSLFYLKFIKDNAPESNYWLNASDTPAIRAWSGYAYEMVCFNHITQIKKALGISGVASKNSSWLSNETENSVQVDLLIDRRDQVITMCEVKFSVSEFTINKSYADQLRRKITVFKQESETRKSVYLALITTFGLKQNAYSGGIVQNSLTMEHLFEQP